MPLAASNTHVDAILSRVDLHGRSVLDIGAWNGLFSFEAKRRGAAHVLATDSFCWTHPLYRGRETFDLVQSVTGLDVDAREIDAAELSRESLGRDFDIVLFLGVFYHRFDAIEVLGRVARLARQLLVVETHLDLREIDRPAMAFYPGSELSNDPTNWWAPNERCMETLLLSHGFAEVETSGRSGDRGIFHAWRSTDARTRPLLPDERLKPATRGLRSKIVRELRRPFSRLLR